MVSLEIEKPSNWSLGKKMGIIAIILLILSPFLPYRIHDVITDGQLERSLVTTYIEIEMFGGMRFLPIISGLLIGILLYFKLDFYTIKDSEHIKINHFVLMIWGSWFFLTYLEQVIEHTHSGDYGDVYPGYGLWMMVVGSFLCIAVGFLEWRYPAVTRIQIPQKALPKKKEPDVTIQTGPVQTPDVMDTEEPEKVSTKPVVTIDAPKPVPKAESTPVTPSAEPQRVEKVGVREPASEEEKTLLCWAKHINQNGQTFEQCMKCGKFVFLSTKDSDASIVFECPDCGESFNLKK